MYTPYKRHKSIFSLSLKNKINILRSKKNLIVHLQDQSNLLPFHYRKSYNMHLIANKELLLIKKKTFSTPSRSKGMLSLLTNIGQKAQQCLPAFIQTDKIRRFLRINY